MVANGVFVSYLEFLFSLQQCDFLAVSIIGRNFDTDHKYGNSVMKIQSFTLIKTFADFFIEKQK